MSSLAKKIKGDPKAVEVFFTDTQFCIRLADGREIRSPLEYYSRLKNATKQQRDNYKLIGQGEGIHWPDLDEDLSVQGILLGLPVVNW